MFTDPSSAGNDNTGFAAQGHQVSPHSLLPVPPPAVTMIQALRLKVKQAVTHLAIQLYIPRGNIHYRATTMKDCTAAYLWSGNQPLVHAGADASER
jgi:hypothetical protein